MVSSRVWSAICTAIAAVTPLTATAQTAPGEVVVTGERTPLEANRQILRSIAPRVRFDEPLPRVTAGLCVKVGGLKPVTMQAIADRIVANAATAGLNVLGAGCQANVLVLFVGNGQSEVQRLLAKEAWVFGDASPKVIRDFAGGPGPARLFKRTSAMSRDGDVENSSATIGMAGGQDLEVEAPVLKQPSASRIGPAVRRSIDAMVLLIDKPSLIDKTPIQIADYATMKTLADGRYSKAAKGNTILGLFSDGVTPPSELTVIDRSLLRALYADRQLQTAAAEIDEAAKAATRE